MSWFCGRCGSPNGQGVPNCSVCGSPPPQAQPQAGGWGQQQPQGGFGGASPSPQAATPGWGGGGAAGGFGGTPGAPGGAGGFGGAPGAPGGFGGAPGAPGGFGGAPGGFGGGPGGPGGPGGFGPRPAKSDNTGLKIGCGIAGCLGVVLVIVVVLVVFVFAGKSGSGASASPSRPSSRGAPTSGGLRQMIPQRVGEWALESVKPVEVSGSNEALIAAYRSGSLTMVAGVAAYSSTSGAQSHNDGMISNHRSKYGGASRNITITGSSNQALGAGVFFSSSNPEAFYYRINKVSFLIQGPPGRVLEFAKGF